MFVVGLLLGLLLAACGGGSTSGGSESTSAATESTGSENTGSGEGTDSGESNEKGSGGGVEEAEGKAAGGGSDSTEGNAGANPEGTEGSGEGESATGSSGKAKVIKQGEAICKKARKEQVKGFASFSKERKKGTSKAAFIEEIIREVTLPPIQAAAEQLATIGAPDDIVAGLEEAVAEAEVNPFSLSGASNSNPFDKVDRRAARYGLKSCARLA